MSTIPPLAGTSSPSTGPITAPDGSMPDTVPAAQTSTSIPSGDASTGASTLGPPPMKGGWVSQTYPGQVAGDSGPAQTPGQVAGDSGPAQTPGQTTQAPPTTQTPPTQVAGDSSQKPPAKGDKPPADKPPADKPPADKPPADKPPVTPPPRPTKPKPTPPPPPRPTKPKPTPPPPRPSKPKPTAPPPPPPTPPKPSKPKPKPPTTGGGGPVDRSTVRLGNKDRNSSVSLTSSKGTFVEIYGDPHVRAKVNGVDRRFDIGYGPGRIKLKDGTTIKWDTYDNSSRALRNFSIDAPGRARDNSVRTNDGKDVHNQLTNLNDTQLREFIHELSEFRGDWRRPLNHNEGSGIDTSPRERDEKRQSHTVKRGDTLSAIGRRHAVSVEQLVRLNNISNPNMIRVGQVIQLP